MFLEALPAFSDELLKVAGEDTRDVKTKLRHYAGHSALNLGQAARDVRYFLNHPDADKIAPEGTPKHMLASATARLPSLASNLYYAALPPGLHHTPEELATDDEATAKELFLHGYAPWKYKLKSAAAPTLKERAHAHFDAAEPDWRGFEKNLQKPGFRKAVKRHPYADDKLQRYVDNFGGYVGSKDVVCSVPSRTNPYEAYEIRRLPNGRLGCGCKDWQFKHSHRGSDCDHIEAARKAGFKVGAKVNLQKAAAAPLASGFLRGAGAMRRFDGAKKTDEQGKRAQEAALRVRMSLPR